MSPERLASLRGKINDPGYVDSAIEFIADDLMSGHSKLPILTEDQIKQANRRGPDERLTDICGNYSKYKAGCRCEDCRAAYNIKQRMYRERYSFKKNLTSSNCLQ